MVVDVAGSGRKSGDFRLRQFRDQKTMANLGNLNRVILKDFPGKRISKNRGNLDVSIDLGQGRCEKSDAYGHLLCVG